MVCVTSCGNFIRELELESTQPLEWGPGECELDLEPWTSTWSPGALDLDLDLDLDLEP